MAVVTIDPAKRLAGALGVERALDNEPQRVDPELLAAHGVEPPGELWATMLDAKVTFDALITRLAPDERAREEALSNRIYQEVSSAVAGTQEFSAIAKLYELHREGSFDTIVLDTPPSRNALDFLDAPTRMTRFLEGRALQDVPRPQRPRGARARPRHGSRALDVLALHRRRLLADLSAFFGSLAGMVDGFRERAHAVEELLRDPATAFLLVTSPEPEQARETIFFAEQLAAAGMERAGRDRQSRAPRRPRRAHSRRRCRRCWRTSWASGWRRASPATWRISTCWRERDRASVERLERRWATASRSSIPHLDQDVHDLAGLARIAEHLFA